MVYLRGFLARRLSLRTPLLGLPPRRPSSCGILCFHLSQVFFNFSSDLFIGPLVFQSRAVRSPHSSDISCFLPAFGFWSDTFAVGKGAWCFRLLRFVETYFVARGAPRGEGRVFCCLGQDASCVSVKSTGLTCCLRLPLP